MAARSLVRFSVVFKVCLASFALHATPAAAAQEPKEEPFFKGFSIGSKKDGSRLEIHGKFQSDWAAFSASDGVRNAIGPFSSGAELRRARLSFAGTLYDWLEFHNSVDLAGGGSALRDAWVETAPLGPAGNLRIGQFKEPFGLEQLEGSGDLTFMERSVGSTLTPGRNLGVMLSSPYASKRGTWALGMFHEDVISGTGSTAASDSGFAATGRVTFLPWHEEGGRRLAHLGFNASARGADRSDARFKTEPEIHLAPNIVDTKSFASTDTQMLSAEGGVVVGIAALQGEFFLTRLSLPSGDGVTFPGYYVQASCFLTGESRGYSRSGGHFSGPDLISRYTGDDDSLGAWEVAARYSSLDLDSSSIFGGVVRDATLGLNWYVNETMKVQLNYIYSELEGFGAVRGIAVRCQLDW